MNEVFLTILIVESVLILSFAVINNIIAYFDYLTASVNPRFNILSAVLFILFHVYNYQQVTDSGTYCILYLWGVLLLALILGNIYLYRCIKLIYIVKVGSLKDKYYAKELESFRLSKSSSLVFNKIDLFLSKHESIIGNLKWYFLITTIVGIISIGIVSIVEPIYHEPFNKCDIRTTGEIILIAIMLLYYSVCFIGTFIILNIPCKCSMTSDNIISRMVKYVAISWIIVALGLLIGSLIPDSMGYITMITFAIPFFVENLTIMIKIRNRNSSDVYNSMDNVIDDREGKQYFFRYLNVVSYNRAFKVNFCYDYNKCKGIEGNLYMMWLKYFNDTTSRFPIDISYNKYIKFDDTIEELSKENRRSTIDKELEKMYKYFGKLNDEYKVDLGRYWNNFTTSKYYKELIKG